MADDYFYKLIMQKENEQVDDFDDEQKHLDYLIEQSD